MQQLKAARPEASTTGNNVEAADAPNARTRFVVPLLAVLASAAFLYLTFAVCWAKFSRAEVFFAECAREMVAYNNLVTPLYQHKPFFDKPILVYWLIVAMYKTFGVSHMVARIPSIFAALCSVSLTGIATRALAQNKKDIAGLVAAMMVASSFMFFSFAYLCMSDMFLVMFDTITMMLIYAGINNDRRRTMYWLLAATSMGFAFVTKGPVGIVLPGIAAVAYLALTRRLSYIKLHHVIVGAVIAGLIAVPWFYAAYLANGTWALAYFFIRENFQRYAGSTYDTHKPIWFMVVSLFTGFLPWSVFLPGAAADFFQQCKQRLSTPDAQNKLYLWLWLATVTGFFSLSRGKCDYYILPIYPAAAALTALYVTEKVRTSPRILALIMSGIFLAVGVGAPIVLSQFSLHSGIQAWWMMPTALIVFGAVGLASAASNRLIACITCLFCAICCAGSGFASQLLPAITQSQSLDMYAQAMRATPPYTRIGVHTGLGHWVDELTFQVERDPVELSDAKSITGFFAQGPGMALIPEPNYEQALSESSELRAMPLRVLDRRMVSSHPLTPGYVLKRKGNLYDTTLLLVAN